MRNKQPHDMTAIPLRITIARSHWSRMIGLMGKRSWPEDQALLILDCPRIHTWFMRFPIDVVFLRGSEVVQVIEALPPWHISPLICEATGCLELAAHQAKHHGLVQGAIVTI